jgi:hypothetical protein
VNFTYWIAGSTIGDLAPIKRALRRPSPADYRLAMLDLGGRLHPAAFDIVNIGALMEVTAGSPEIIVGLIDGPVEVIFANCSRT